MPNQILIGAVAVAVFATGGCKEGARDEYIRRSKATEGQVALKRIVKNLEIYADVNGKLVAGTAPLTPDKPCCSYPDHLCPVEDPAWRAEPWSSLDFAMIDPHRYQISYESDGTTFTARAVADLDCDGTAESTLTAQGSVDQGKVTFTITQ